MHDPNDITKMNYPGPFNYKAFFKVPMNDIDFFLADLLDFRFKHNYHRLLIETLTGINSIGTYVVDFTINVNDDRLSFEREVSELEFFVRCVEHDIREVRQVELLEPSLALPRL
ncbi:hypothetical protein PHBOTO_005259 [Pseudozyma hubeiensis]|nr:hypothetical protein PHBOTO_005259 [Pseudozyma hubeiensis]